MKYRVLILGQGGREHALAEHLAASPLLDSLWVCPGNAGMSLRGLSCVADDGADAVVAFCQQNRVHIVVPGPEAYMVTDLKARLHAAGVYCFAPTPHLAQLESSKRFAKGILREAGLPTARAEQIDDLATGRRALAAHDFARGGIVLKADGLAAGKGVVVCPDRGRAEQALHALAAAHGFPMLLEEELAGPELSAFALCAGDAFCLLGTACDYKRISPDPYSANTGGMGAYSPCDFIDDADWRAINRIFARTLQVLGAQGQRYEGFLFAGLMKTATGIQVLEFNVRLGDPEAQALLPRLGCDLLALIVQARDGQLQTAAPAERAECAVHVVAASQGYPQADMLLGQAITLPPDLTGITFAGVSSRQGQLVNSGGRVLGAAALAPSRARARARAYERLGAITFNGMYCRPDIGQ
ncbi:MAG: phosphoribosylamine--glycine ligase [Ottowia sp.]|nr:phosphoribosylamine--glycine ligase [Ottowia sp.]